MTTRITLLLSMMIVASMACCSCSDQDAKQESSTNPTDDTANATTQTADVQTWLRAMPVEDLGITFEHQSGHDGEHFLIPEITCGGAALLDFDNDGDLDIYLVQAGRYGNPKPETTNKLYRNNGDMTFEDVTYAANVGDTGYGMGVATGDFNNDGFVDIYVTNVGPNVLYKNDGDGSFTDVSASSNTDNSSLGAGAAFLDIDNDGLLDLYVANYLHWSPEIEPDCLDTMGSADYCAPRAYNAPARDVLFHNQGNGTFQDVTISSGISAKSATGLGVVCADFNGDGATDIYVANDGMNNMLWINQGDGTFKDDALVLGCAVDDDGHPNAGMGVSAADPDFDGDFDLLVVNLNTESDSFYRNQGHYYIEESVRVGLASESRIATRFGTAMIDLNNDGLLDIFHANGAVTREFGDPDVADAYAQENAIYKGIPGSWERLDSGAIENDAPVRTSRAAAFGDLDNDGRTDIVIVNRDAPATILQNVTTKENSWIGFDIRNEHGAPALGAVITIEFNDEHRCAQVRTGYSYLAANDARLLFGLGDPDRSSIPHVSIKWADGTSELIDHPFSPGTYHRIQKTTTQKSLP